MILSLKVLLAIHIEIGVGIKINLGFSIKHMKKNHWNPLPEKWASMARKKGKKNAFWNLYFSINSWFFKYSIQFLIGKISFKYILLLLLLSCFSRVQLCVAP